MKMLKKAASAAMALLMLTAGLSLIAHAETSETVGDYVVSTGFDQGIMIEEYKGSDAQVVIPSQITVPSSGQTLTVFGIGESAFASNLSAVSVTIPDTVKQIGQEAFSNCSKIESLTLGNSIEEIGVSAFSFCESIEQLRLPDSLRVLGSGAFQYCESLLTVHTGDGIETITSGSFSRCESLQQFTIGKNVKTIESNTFLESGQLEEVWFNEKADTISASCFDPKFTGKLFCYFESAADTFANGNNFEHEHYKLTGLTVVAPDKTTYYEGETVITNGLKATAKYKNAPSRDVTDKCVVDTAYFDEDNGRFIEVKYIEGTTEVSKYIPLTFNEDVITDIEVTKLPDTLIYRYRYRHGINLSGIALEVTYESGKKETVEDISFMTVTGFNNTKRGTQTIVVGYEGLTANLDVTVKVLWWQWALLIVCFGWIWYR